MDGLAIGAETRLGRVVSVSGSQVVTLLEKEPDYEQGERTLLQIGTLVKMRTAISTVFGLVTALNIPMPAPEQRAIELKLVELELIGEVLHKAAATETGAPRPPSRFQRGVSIFPALGEGVYAATQEDLALVYASPSVSAVRVGTVHQDRSLPAYVMTDELLGKHFAVLGSTGTGKSCAVALILRAILSQHPNGHMVLLDMHNEYAHAFGSSAEVLSPGSFELPYWLFTFEEIEEIALGGSKERHVEGAILGELILAAKRLFAGDPQKAELIMVDSPVPYRLGDVARLLDEAAGKLDKGRDPAPYLRLKARLAVLQSDPRFAFMFPGLSVRDNMGKILSQIFRVPVAGRPVTIIDLSSVPSEILNVVVSVLCRMTFDFALWSERSMPILLVCEEAHRYCPVDTTIGFEPAKRALARIAKEGRKYGVSLCLVSQRPSELAPSVLSQCNTIFALRMGHQSDQAFVRGALSESAMGLLDFLPSLRNAEAIAVGEGVSVPVRLCFDPIPDNSRPLSGTASFSSAWSRDHEDSAFLSLVVERWRRQRR
jgi:DNA helicase HerA-like ATPase